MRGGQSRAGRPVQALRAGGRRRMRGVANPPALVRKADEDRLLARAKRANGKHAACLKDNRSALHRAHEAGEELAAAQKEVYATQGHEWVSWVEGNLDFDRFRAAEY